MYGNSKDAFFNYFRVVEDISRYRFEKVEDEYTIKQEILRKLFKKVIKEDLKIIYSDDKIEYITGEVAKTLKYYATDGIGGKISFYCNKFSIIADYKDINIAKNYRDDIAHATYVDVNDEKFENSFKFIAYLAPQIFSKEYFYCTYMDVRLPFRLEV